MDKTARCDNQKVIDFLSKCFCLTVSKPPKRKKTSHRRSMSTTPAV